MANVCEALVSSGGDEETPGDSVNSAISTLAHSRICFESVLRIYYLRHGYEIPDGHLCHAAFGLACKALAQRSLPASAGFISSEAVSPDEAKSTLILAAKGLADQGMNYYLPRALFEIVESEMSTEDRSLVHQYITIRRDDTESLQSRSTYISSQYPVGIVSMHGNPDGRRLDRLTEEFTTLALGKAHDSATTPHKPNIQ